MILYDPKWNLDKNSLEFLKFLIKAFKIKKVLEIGTFNGYTANELCKISEVTSIEKDQNNTYPEGFHVIYGNALTIIPNLNSAFDLILIDATKKEYIDYIKLLEKYKIVNNNTIIIADNVISHKSKVQNYLDYVKENYHSFTLDIGKGLEISKK